MRESTHGTREKLVATAVQLLEELPPEQVTSALLLERSGVSKGSLYHFFQDFQELLDEAYLRRFRGRIDEDLAAVRSLVGSSSSSTEFFEQVHAITLATQSADRAANRFERARVLAIAEHDPRLRVRLGEMQRELNEGFSESIAAAQAKGWLTSDVPARAIAVFMQAYTLGVLIEDVSAEPLDKGVWADLIARIARVGLG